MNYHDYSYFITINYYHEQIFKIILVSVLCLQIYKNAEVQKVALLDSENVMCTTTLYLYAILAIAIQLLFQLVTAILKKLQ